MELHHLETLKVETQFAENSLSLQQLPIRETLSIQIEDIEAEKLDLLIECVAVFLVQLPEKILGLDLIRFIIEFHQLPIENGFLNALFPEVAF